jgi:hypothetical protein
LWLVAAVAIQAAVAAAVVEVLSPAQQLLPQTRFPSSLVLEVLDNLRVQQHLQRFLTVDHLACFRFPLLVVVRVVRHLLLLLTGLGVRLPTRRLAAVAAAAVRVSQLLRNS